MPDRESCEVVSTFLVAEYIKGKVTGMRDSRQVDFFHKVVEDAANLYVKEYLNHGFQMLCSTMSTEFEAIETDETGVFELSHFGSRCFAHVDPNVFFGTPC